jgi:hypothetical protein
VTRSLDRVDDRVGFQNYEGKKGAARREEKHTLSSINLK